MKISNTNRENFKEIEDAQLIPSKLDAVLPLMLKDYDRFLILDKSIDIFCNDILKTVWVIVPDTELEILQTKIKNQRYRVIPESCVVPEARLYRPKGWYLQQIIKLAVANYVETDFYLTLDADVVCVKTIQYLDLIRDGCAVYHSANNNTSTDNFWYNSLFNILKLDPSFLPRYNYYNVTPTVLHKNSVIQLHKHLNDLSHQELKGSFKISNSRKQSLLLLASWILFRLLPNSSSLKESLANYKSYLMRNIPWTEYQIYYNFCDSRDLLDKHHIWIPNCIYAGKESIWKSDSYEAW